MRLAFFPYDILILAGATLLSGILIKRTLFRKLIYQRWTDKLFPYALVYLPISILFMFVFDELPVKLFLQDDYATTNAPQLSPQGMPIDEKRLYALVYNSVIWLFCLVVVITHLVKRRKLASTDT